ncbi:hypothetical protein F6S89_22425 [Escherichia coli]|nr:hypothetical protein [Escherichia coli]EGF7432253.1 hypothetical protein [Escherichia coli]EKH2413703.1 hypothetical protein [Escherichia coli]MED8779505.1 hypothetical protein [Escherichia coli]HCP1755389.1 hypothetical protein [Escherichia coli]
MATLSDTIKPNKTYLEAVLRTTLLGKTEDEYVDFVLDDRPALTLIAATLYSQERFDNGQIYSAWHLLPVPEEVDDQDYEFESYDLEVEALAQSGEKT